MSVHLPSTSRRRAGLAMLVLLAGALTACGFGRATEKDKIAETTGAYLRAMADDDTATACAQLSARVSDDRCRQEIERQLSRLSPAVLKRAADASLNISVHGRTATSSLGQPHGARLNLVKRGASWRIDSGFAVPTARLAGGPVIVGAGELVDIGGGRRLYLHCVGAGRPTVVLEAGFGAGADIWRTIQANLGLATRTCAYDRAGLGNSVAIRGTHDAADEILDLRRLLHAAHVEPPYVLVGHSYGGLLVRLFAHEHPHDVAGVALIDAMGRDQTRRQLAIWPESQFRAIRRSLAAPVRDGVDVAAGEALASHVRSLGATPLAVVTAGRHDAEWGPATPRLRRGLDRLWTTMQDELANLSSDRLHVVALHSDHFIQAADGQPLVAIRAIRALVRAARRHASLPACRQLFTQPGARCR